MAGAQFEEGIRRARRLEANHHPQGRGSSGTPMNRLKGDTNPTKSGGINRPTAAKRGQG